MQRLLLLVLFGLGGVVAGGGSALAVLLLRPETSTALGKESARVAESDELPEFVPADLLLPLVFADGQLAGYASVKLQLRVATGSGEAVKARLPLLLNAVNLQTFRTPLAAGTDGRLPDLARLRGLIQRSADQSLGTGTITQVAITEARTQ